MENMLFLWKIACILIISPYASEAASLVCYKGSIRDFKELSLKESPQFLAVLQQAHFSSILQFVSPSGYASCLPF
ncbi:unnamed protein product [Arctia plantaginis]|uniref:Uncharacterized protein n=1 Tax=Arctia plantaginis TaxID=874455 RepID=A0A8S0YXP2_ARCPL|nr:unnamed protein product [Arctia plantaginis]